MSKIAIMQPTFNPWIGYFDLINGVDKFLFLDTVQLNQQSWQTRNKLKVANKELMISIPIKKNISKFELLIKDANINSFEFKRRKLMKTIRQEYGRSDCFEEVIGLIEQFINLKTDNLCEYNINIIENISRRLGINTIFQRASSFGEANEKKSKLVLSLCKKLNASAYYSPLNAKGYLEKDANDFRKNKIQIVYQNYKHPVYKQLGKEFIPYIGIFDLILNNGFENSLSIIQGGTNYERN